MDQVIDFFKGLFNTNLWPARWHCGYWSDFHGWFYILSDLLIWSAYFAIPLIIVSFIRRQKGMRFLPVYYLFAAFILACGTTHLIDAITFWVPLYRFNALIRFFTGVISWVTVFYLIKVLPLAFTLKPVALLEAEIEQRKKAEEELQFKIRQLNESQEIARMGHWEWDIKKNDILWSESLFKIFDITPRTSGLTFETYLDFVHPEDRAFTENIIKTAAEKREFPDFYHRIITPKGKVKTIQGRGEIITAPDHSVVKMIGTAQDVTEEKRTEQELLVKSNELAATNNELQKFAYVASHDLQEPLRKIKTFSAILQTDYKDAIDDKGNEYMGKIINASERMQQLINDVLSFSQLNIPVPGFKPTELETVLRDVVGDLEVAIENTKTVIEHTPLPVIDANNSQMGQLFQNLISNAIKFKQPGMAPHISITANIIWAEQSAYLAAPHHRYKFANLGTRFWQTEKFLRLIFKDNGIGFEPQFAERIFSLFQRLNPREAFQGTGIGLSICKKIVENHHGIIYAESEPGKGASFIVILPVSQSNFEGGE